MDRVLGIVGEEVQKSQNERIIVDNKLCRVQLLFVSDLKVVYSILGTSEPSLKHPCPWWIAPMQMMRFMPDTILSQYKQLDCAWLPPRPELEDLRVTSLASKFQKPCTYNLFRVKLSIPCNVVVPPLHVLLGLVNK